MRLRSGSSRVCYVLLSPLRNILRHLNVSWQRLSNHGWAGRRLGRKSRSVATGHKAAVPPLPRRCDPAALQWFAHCGSAAYKLCAQREERTDIVTFYFPNVAIWRARWFTFTLDPPSSCSWFKIVRISCRKLLDFFQPMASRVSRFQNGRQTVLLWPQQRVKSEAVSRMVIMIITQRHLQPSWRQTT